MKRRNFCEQPTGNSELRVEIPSRTNNAPAHFSLNDQLTPAEFELYCSFSIPTSCGIEGATDRNKSIRFKRQLSGTHTRFCTTTSSPSISVILTATVVSPFGAGRE